MPKWTIPVSSHGCPLVVDGKKHHKNRHGVLLGSPQKKSSSPTTKSAKFTDVAIKIKWLQVREYRVTASNFGRVLKAVKRQSFPPSLFKTLRGQYASTECATAVKWGKTHEKEAVRAYSALHRVVVEAAGMFVDESGMLAATPDGLIGDREIIEVKCPYSARNCTIEDVASKTKNFFLRPSGGSLVLDTEHDYYHQIQGNLHLGNRSLCHLVVWTPLQLAVIGVPYDHSWGKNVETLKLFYQNVYLPHLFGAL